MLNLVVVNYKTPDDLETFFDSYMEHRPWDVECLLTIIDVQPDKPAAGRFDWEGVDYNAVHVNAGYGYWVNTVWFKRKYAPVKAFAAFNADTVFTGPTIGECYDALLSHRLWGALGPCQVNSQGKVTHGGIVGTNTQPRLRWWQEKYDPAIMRTVDEVVSVSGAAYFMRREAYQCLLECDKPRRGPFLETRHYYEETWCSYHLRSHGWKVVYYGQSQMLHEWHRSHEIGSEADEQMPKAQGLFRERCSAHGIECD